MDWTVPADRIKAGREHRALAILEDLSKIKESEFVFPCGKRAKLPIEGGQGFRRSRPGLSIAGGLMKSGGERVVKRG